MEAGYRLLGEKPSGVETPGGRNRDSLRLHLAGRSVIATNRKDRRRAELEVFVLRALARQRAAVPTVLAFDGDWILQEDLGSLRLSEAVAGARRAKAEALLDAAIVALVAVQAAGKAARLAGRVVTLGHDRQWLARFVDTPRRIGGHLGIAAPDLPVEALSEQLAVRRPCFVKWDARPGNAAVRDDQGVAWFDWEHCGCRNSLDDLAWLLGDEYVPDSTEIEARLLNKHLTSFADAGGSASAMDYLRSFGTLHMAVRLALILSRKGDRPWHVLGSGLMKDQIGASASQARRTCLRAARWAEETTLLRPLALWYQAVADRLDQDRKRDLRNGQPPWRGRSGVLRAQLHRSPDGSPPQSG